MTTNLEEKLKEIRIDHTDTDEEGYNRLCEEEVAQIMLILRELGWSPPIFDVVGVTDDVIDLSVKPQTVTRSYACDAEACYMEGDHYHTWSGRVYDVTPTKPTVIHKVK